MAIVTDNTVELPDSEWTDAKGVRKRFGIGTSTLYRLMADGRIKSTSLRRKGSCRGKRLFSVESIKNLIEANATGGEDA